MTEATEVNMKNVDPARVDALVAYFQASYFPVVESLKEAASLSIRTNSIVDVDVDVDVESALIVAFGADYDYDYVMVDEGTVDVWGWDPHAEGDEGDMTWRLRVEID